eukprot:15241719-Alexandrium_andersonii.AAC.1
MTSLSSIRSTNSYSSVERPASGAGTRATAAASRRPAASSNRPGQSVRFGIMPPQSRRGGRPTCPRTARPGAACATWPSPSAPP